jgi:hypothetical protein
MSIKRGNFKRAAETAIRGFFGLVSDEKVKVANLLDGHKYIYAGVDKDTTSVKHSDKVSTTLINTPSLIATQSKNLYRHASIPTVINNALFSGAGRDGAMIMTKLTSSIKMDVDPIRAKEPELPSSLVALAATAVCHPSNALLNADITRFTHHCMTGLRRL